MSNVYGVGSRIQFFDTQRLTHTNTHTHTHKHTESAQKVGYSTLSIFLVNFVT